ncbi:MAG: PD40 domain-containing protein [Endomicrobiales bacterium]|nr:PD40 domain-containing protein [Endomicrobiales bacterium]
MDVYLSLSAHGQRTDFAFAGFIPENESIEEAKFCRMTGAVLRADLLFSRYFNLVEGGPFFTGKDEELLKWADLGVDILIAGWVSVSGENLKVKAAMMDVGSRRHIWQRTYKGTVHEYRRLAHEINDDIVLHFTGERGIAHTKIVFTNNQTGKKELYVMDYDGQNVRRLTSDNSINILPEWSPDGEEILYTTYKHGNPDLYALKLSNNSKRAVSVVQGLNAAGSYSPDGRMIALTISAGKNPNLYLITPRGEALRKLTRGTSIETSPSFAPNGREIVFISDKPGYPQPYIMNLDGTNIRRLYTEGFSDSPAWSPRGDMIVFSMRLGRENYDLYIYNLERDRISRLTQDEKNNENPSWSPDGRFIAFTSTRSGRSEIYVIAADGSGQKKVADIPGASFTPSWSP